MPTHKLHPQSKPPDRPSMLPEGNSWPPQNRVYNSDHPARSKAQSSQSFNEDWAVQDFGQEYFDEISESQPNFRGDWWFLCLLLICESHASTTDPNAEDQARYGWWKNRRLRLHGIIIHLEGAELHEHDFRRIDFRNSNWNFCGLFNSKLSNAFFTSSSFEHADLDEADFENASLSMIRFSRTQIVGASFKNSKIRNSVFDDCYLKQSDFTLADLGFTRFSKCELRDSNFDSAILENATIIESSCTMALLSRARCTNADFSRSDFQYSEFFSAVMRRCKFDHTDIRSTHGILFDSNDSDRMRIDGNSKDPWSILRRKYTGPRYLVNLLLLIAFLLPFGARVLHLTATAQIQTSLLSTAEHAAAASDETVRALGTRIHDGIDTYQSSHTQVPALWVLVGGTKGTLFVCLTVVVVSYNLLRLFLTSRVSALREAEERSRVTPALEDYYGKYHPISDARPTWRSWRNPVQRLGLYRIHIIAKWLLYIASAAFIWNIGHWLLTTWVWVPR